MKFAHLPLSGGINDQASDLIAAWGIVWSVEAEVADEERRKQSRKSGGQKRPKSRYKPSTI